MFNKLSKNSSFIIVGVFLILMFSTIFIGQPKNTQKTKVNEKTNSISDSLEKFLSNDIQNTVYNIEGRFVKLTDGVSIEDIIPGSATKIITRYIGKDLVTDLNKDLLDDSIFFLTQEEGGSGKFYYVVASINVSSGYLGSNAFFIGDRIDPTSITLREDGAVIVKYMDRNPNDSFDKKPYISKEIILYFDVETMNFIQIF